MSKGKFIVIDGPEGAGKTTLCNELKEEMSTVVFTREPGGSELANALREIILGDISKDADALTHFLMFWAARRDHVQNTILPALQNSKTVISDRFDSSTFLYQIYGQQHDDLKDLFWRMRKEVLADCEPDMYIFLNITHEKGLKRKQLASQELNHFDLHKIEFHDRVREGMKVFQGFVPHKVVNAARLFEDVKKEVKKIICS